MATKDLNLNKFTLGNLRISSDLPQIVFMWPLAANGQKADGTYGWSMFGDEQSQVVFECADPDLKIIHASVYEEDHNVYNSGGFLSVEEIEQDGKKYLTGMFAIDKAGIIERSTAEHIGTGSAIGTFKVQRGW
jgi:hypothetical protein